jgi:hypothetical protein
MSLIYSDLSVAAAEGARERKADIPPNEYSMGNALASGAALCPPTGPPE